MEKIIEVFQETSYGIRNECPICLSYDQLNMIINVTNDIAQQLNSFPIGTSSKEFLAAALIGADKTIALFTEFGLLHGSMIEVR